MVITVDFSPPIDDHCEATSVSFGLSNRPTRGWGSDGSSRAQINDLTFVKKRDSLSPLLMHHLVIGTLFPQVSIRFYQSAGGAVSSLYTLSGVSITGLSIAGESENVTMNFEKADGKRYGD